MAERILVIDGDEGMRRMLEIFLAREGYLVDTVQGVREAAAILESNDYRIILIDDDLAGIEANPEGAPALLSRVRPESLFTPVVIMIGNPVVETTDRVSGAGVACFMSKPFSLADLRQKIEALLPGQAGRTLSC